MASLGRTAVPDALDGPDATAAGSIFGEVEHLFGQPHWVGSQRRDSQPSKVANASRSRGRVLWRPATDAEGATPLRQPLRHPDRAGQRCLWKAVGTGNGLRPPMGKGDRVVRAPNLSGARRMGEDRGRGPVVLCPCNGPSGVRRCPTNQPSRTGTSAPMTRPLPPCSRSSVSTRSTPWRPRRSRPASWTSSLMVTRPGWTGCRRPPARPRRWRSCGRWPTPTPLRSR